MPGVGASGVEIEAHSPDLSFITAYKQRFVRVNWEARCSLRRLNPTISCACVLGAGF